MAGQRPLLERAAAGDREAFAQLYDGQVEGVYRYLVAWTGDRAEAAALTGQVFQAALDWLPVTAGGEGEAGAWLIAMARDAVAHHPGTAGSAGSADGAVAAVARLGDPEREVVVLRLLLGHSLAHTAHLSGYGQRAVLELQLAACLAIAELTGNPTAAPEGQTASVEEFERRLGSWEIDPTGSDPALAAALSAAGSLRQAIPGYVVAPDPDLVAHLRQKLASGAPPVPGPPLADPAGLIGTRQPEGAEGAGRGLLKRPWVATGVATVGIVVVLALQAFGQPPPTGTCDGRPCPASTTVVAAAGGGSVGTPLTTVLQPTTTSSTVPAQGPAPTAPQPSGATAPPTTRPASTAPATTAPRPTTTRAPTTTAPTTTAPTTTTTAPPVTT